MKLILFLFIYPFFLVAFKNKNETQSPITSKSSSYEEIPLFIKEKPPVEVSLPDHIISSNIQTHTTFLGNEPQIQASHMDHGFNMDNIDPDLQIVRSKELAQNNKNIENLQNDEQNVNTPAYSNPKNTEENAKLQENIDLDRNNFQNINGEAIQRLNKTHTLIKKTYERLKVKGKNLKNRKEIHGFLEKVNYFKEALNLHNDDLSRTIFQNYKILESVTQEILKIREDLLENAIVKGKTRQSKDHLNSLQNLKKQIQKMRSLIKLLGDLKKDEQVWTDTKVLSATLPKKIVRYFDLNNQIYQVNKWVHINENNPLNSIQILKREAYYDPTKCANQIHFLHFKQYENIVSEQSEKNNEISDLLSKSFDVNTTQSNGTFFQERFVSKEKSIEADVEKFIFSLKE